jgi:hypothetical protein
LKAVQIPVRFPEESAAFGTEAEKAKRELGYLSRWNGSVAWVIGDRSQSKAPQLWFQKDAFIPMRMNYVSALDQARYEFQWESVQFVRGFPYPKTLTVLRDGPNPLFSVQLLDLSFTKPAGSGVVAAESGLTHAGESQSIEMKDAIRTYYGIAK